jgi:twitching motility protein PilT
VISQRLVRNKDNTSRVPAVEVLITTPYIRDCIVNQEKTPLIRDAIAQGTSQYGMQTFDQSLHDLLNRGLISYEQALNGASNRDEFVLRTKGIQTAADQAREEMENRLVSRSGGTGPLNPADAPQSGDSAISRF